VLASRRVLVVLNPAAGKARSEAVAAELRAALDEVFAHAELVRTRDADEATRLAAAAADDGFDVVLAAGGDGTVTAVASGVLAAGARLDVGIVPIGTGNGLARVLRLPIDPRRATLAMAGGRRVTLDVVRLTRPEGLALLFFGAGLDAEINRDADAPAKARFGFVAYVGAALRNLLRRRNRPVVLTLDGRRERLLAHTVTAFNAGQLEFAGLEIGPRSDPHDGRLDVTPLRAPGFWRSLAAVLRLASGRPLEGETRRARRIRVESSPPLLVHVDGDVIGTTPVEAEVLPGALRFIAAAEYDGDRPELAP
jgi:diacylglycerol kinase (ATP)